MNPRLIKVAIAVGLVTIATALISLIAAPLMGIAMALILSPFAREKRIWFVGDVATEVSIIAKRREESLRALKDLEDERNRGKLSEEDFRALRPRYLETAKELTRQLDLANEYLAAARRRLDKELAEAAASAERRAK